MSAHEIGDGHIHAWRLFYHTVEADKNQSPADRSSREMQ